MIVLTEPILQRIEQIGKLRFPNEACGVLLPTPKTRHSGEVSQVVELPNRSLVRNAYTILGKDLQLELMEWASDNENRVPEIAIWHTHPQGNVGPSHQDMLTKVPPFHYLVLAFTPDGLIPAWF